MSADAETKSTVPFKYNGIDFTAHLVKLFDPAGTPHTEIDRIVNDDTGEEVEDEDIYVFFFDFYCPD